MLVVDVCYSYGLLVNLLVVIGLCVVINYGLKVL